jgi:hypothetical protein
MAFRFHRLGKGKVLWVRPGMNPNSSSLGTTSTWMLVWGGIVALAGPMLSLVVRGLVRPKKGDDAA